MFRKCMSHFVSVIDLPLEHRRLAGIIFFSGTAPQAATSPALIPGHPPPVAVGSKGQKK